MNRISKKIALVTETDCHRNANTNSCPFVAPADASQADLRLNVVDGCSDARSPTLEDQLPAGAISLSSRVATQRPH